MEDDRLRLIADIVRRCAERQLNLGKIQLQKLVYFLQEHSNRVGYTYVIFHYGPYSFELAEDIERLNTLRVLCIEPDESGYGYHIKPGVHCEVMTNNDDVFFDAHSQALKAVLDSFGEMTASDIELAATIHFVNAVLSDQAKGDIGDDVITAVKELKPHFGIDQIAQAMNNLPAPFAP